MLKAERNTAITVGIDDLLASFSSLVAMVFSVKMKFAILVHWIHDSSRALSPFLPVPPGTSD